jgi:Tfp pilus assembly protein PilF
MNLAYLYMLQSSPEKAISELREVIRLDPTNSEANYKLARLLLSEGHVDQCIDFIEKTPAGSGAFLVAVLGDAYLRKGNAEKAEESYLLALNQHGDSEEALLGLAQVAQLKRDARALPLYLSRAKELAGGSPDLLYKFATVALRLAAYEEARSALEDAVRLSPEEPAYFIALGVVWLNKPDVFEAEKAFRHALQLQPDSGRAQMYLGYALLNQKRYPEASAYLEKSIKADASLAEPFYYLGVIAQEQNEDSRAIELLEKATKLLPSFGYVHIALGTAYLKLKNYPRAQQELDLGVKLNPDEPKAHYQLALLYARLKDPQRAQQEMQMVEKLKGTGQPQGKGNIVIMPSEPNPR